MAKKLISTLLSLVILTAAASAAAWPQWADSARIWAEQNGLSDVFLQSPDMLVTRGQTAQMLYEAAGSPAVSAELPFDDVPEAYAAAVTWAAANGFVQGTGDGRYYPDSLVTRQEFAAILYRGAGSPDASSYTLAGYTDQNSVAGWAENAMRWCVGTGLMNGRAADLLTPEGTIIVSEAVMMLQRADQDGSESGEQTVSVSSLDEIKTQLTQAVSAVRQPPVFSVASLADTSNLQIDVQNLYNALLSEHPEYKYAYDMQIDYANGLLRCTFSYMPYLTGDYPAGFQGENVASLQELIQTAWTHLAEESAPIRITNPDLTVDDMNRALQQAGGSYILCQLSEDGTAITFTPQNNLSREQAMEHLSEIERLTEQIIAETVTPEMTETQKAKALYTYLTENVLYDHRYYSDRANMPYDSQTAYGALHDHLAICGGYAQALQSLFEKVGIPCYTVSGSMGSEYHMWNIAYLDGAWRFFDPTSDRGRADYWFNYFGVAADQLTRYTWNTDWVQQLTQSAV